MSVAFGQVAEFVAAMGGGATMVAIVQAVRASRDGARSRESEQAAAVRSEIDRARESERDAWHRADAMETRYDQSKADLNKWMRYAQRLELWIDRNTTTASTELPVRPDEPPSGPIPSQ